MVQHQLLSSPEGERIEGKQVSEAIRGLSPGAAMPFKGEVEDEDQPIIRSTKVPTEASTGRRGPEYIRRMRTARGQNETPKDVEETRRLQMNNIVAEERAKRAASDREQKERDILARRGNPPTQTKVFGDASGQRQVEDDARRQSEDMALSDLIRSMRAGGLDHGYQNNFNGRAIRDGLRIRERVKRNARYVWHT